MSVIEFRVLGQPYPQGSKSAFPVKTKSGKVIARMKESSGTSHAAWRNAVSDAAVAALEEPDARPLKGVLRLDVSFRFRMPASRPKATRLLGRVYKTTAPDLSKLVRAVEDSLTAAGMIDDDAAIAVLACSKWEVVEGWIGALVRVEEILAAGQPRLDSAGDTAQLTLGGIPNGS